MLVDVEAIAEDWDLKKEVFVIKRMEIGFRM